MKLKNISLAELKKILQTEKDFKDLSQWKLKHIPLGEMHHTYKVTKRKKTYFIKELKPHEAQIEYFLSKLKLKHLPFSKYPPLLKKKILVREFIQGKMLRSRKLDLGLVKDFTTFQNKLNDKQYYKKYNIYSGNKFSQKDDGFFKGGIIKNFKFAPKKLEELAKLYGKNSVKQFQEIYDFIEKDKEQITLDFSKMPFARQHYDFREDNIIVGKDKRCRLIDWGSSYGYGPFMFDISDFLVNDKRAFEIYVKNSDICRTSSIEQVNRWLYVALVSKFLGVVRYRLDPSEKRADTKENLTKFLKYEYKTYKRLLRMGDELEAEVVKKGEMRLRGKKSG